MMVTWLPVFPLEKLRTGVFKFHLDPPRSKHQNPSLHQDPMTAMMAAMAAQKMAAVPPVGLGALGASGRLGRSWGCRPSQGRWDDWGMGMIHGDDLRNWMKLDEIS